MMQLLQRIAAVCVGLGFALAASSQPFPQKLIRIVVPFTPGTGTDTLARVIAQNLTESFKQQVIVENRPGANGIIAVESVAKSAPDGYTLLVTTNTTHAANPSLLKSIPYDPIRDFAPVTKLGNFSPSMLAIDPRLPFKSVAELIAYAKANPGKLSYATGNSTGIVFGAKFARVAGIDVLHVPYKSTPPAMADVIGGQVSMIILDFTNGLTGAKAGKIRALALLSDKPHPLMPELTPLARTPGFEALNAFAWLAAFAPAGTPAETVDTLNRGIVRILKRKDIIDKFFEGLGFEAFGSTPQELGAFVASEIKKWAELVKEAGIQPQ
ncbi:MAG: tripartite tricarboxylate transporter substrate binding protein [Betaproteobacteria bacterium]|nr:tripartite tricarboxylate transporter substrate binding protein [Betaproteobacteria bacterium]